MKPLSILSTLIAFLFFSIITKAQLPGFTGMQQSIDTGINYKDNQHKILHTTEANLLKTIVQIDSVIADTTGKTRYANIQEPIFSNSIASGISNISVENWNLA